MEENQSNQSEAKQEIIKKEFKSFAISLKDFFFELLDIREGTDKKDTIQKIKDGIHVKSHTAWILVFSIIIASIGLNISSSAVVIGAMLVSPLMGPILGIGLSIGINDIDTMKSSLSNLGVMVVISVVTSFLFFSIPIFQEETPELIARTKPDVRDVLIAIAGGLTLIVALSRYKEMTNTIAGIAIATALMPPLCTAGYGLAVGNLSFFGGAMFLFIINSIFIALATFVIIKFLKFPVVKYIDSAGRKRIAQLASAVALIIFSYSIYTFVQLYKENTFEQNSMNYINDLEKATGAGIINKKINLASLLDGASVIACNNEHFGKAENILAPGKAKHMGDGWETRRRRGKGNDWLILNSIDGSFIDKIEISTHHFKGNFPSYCSLQAAYLPSKSSKYIVNSSNKWKYLLKNTKLSYKINFGKSRSPFN